MDGGFYLANNNLYKALREKNKTKQNKTNGQNIWKRKIKKLWETVSWRFIHACLFVSGPFLPWLSPMLWMCCEFDGRLWATERLILANNPTSAQHQLATVDGCAINSSSNTLYLIPPEEEEEETK